MCVCVGGCACVCRVTFQTNAKGIEYKVISWHRLVSLKMHTCTQSHALISIPVLLVPSYFHMQINSLHLQPC